MKRVEVLLAVICGLGLLAACGAELPTEEAGSVSAFVSSESLEEAEEAGVGSVAVTVTEAEQEHFYPEGAGEAGDPLMTVSCQSPVIEAAEDSPALALIQADLDQVVEDFRLNAKKGLESAQIEYDEQGESFRAHEYNLLFEVTRSDDRVLSLVAYANAFTGGAHGNTGVICLNYDVSTGKRINMADFDPKFSGVAVEEVLAQAEELTQGENPVTLVPDYADHIRDVVSYSTFYFSDEGVVFVSGEYVIQDYSEGILYFTVPYDRLNEYLPEAYRG